MTMHSIESTSDGGCIVAGKSKSFEGDITGNHPGVAGVFDYWIVKLNSNVNLLWQKSLGGTQTDIANSISSTPDGGYIVSGTSNSSDGDVINNHHTYDYWTVKLNNVGNIQWQRSLGGTDDDETFSAKPTPDGGYVVVGRSWSNDGDVIGNHGYYDYWILKYDGTGNLIWQKSLEGGNGDFAYAIVATSDGGYTVAGGTTSNDGDVSGNHGYDNNPFNQPGDMWIVNLGPDVALPVTLISFEGKVQKEKNLLQWTTTELDNPGFEVQRSSDAVNFYKLGFINSKSGSKVNTILNYDFIDTHFSAVINYYRLKQIDKGGKFSFSKIIALKKHGNFIAQSITLYPNPAKNVLNIEVSSTGENEVTLLLTNLSGKLLLNRIFMIHDSENVIPVDVSKLSSGTYFLKILAEDQKETLVKKFVKQ